MSMMLGLILIYWDITGLDLTGRGLMVPVLVRQVFRCANGPAI